MKKGKILTLLLCSILLVFTGFFLSACGKIDYSNKQLVTLVNNEQKNEITLYKGDTMPVEFQIVGYEKKMNGNLVITCDNNQCISYTQAYHDGVTNLVLTANQGGRARIEAATQDGLLKTDLLVNVLEYSNTLSNKNNNLYVTENSQLQPNSNDFEFSGTSNIRDLTFAFYGIADNPQQKLTLASLPTIQGNYLTFVRAFLAKRSIEDENQFLIFEDKEGNYKTLQWTVKTPGENTQIMLIDATHLGNGYFSFTGGQPMAVNQGDKFTFVAIHENEQATPAFVQRDFYVLKDLQGEKITYSYTFAGDQMTYPLETTENKGIFLIANYHDENVDYRKATLSVTIPSASDFVGFDYDLQLVDGFKIAKLVQTQKIADPAANTTTYSYTLTSDYDNTARSILKFHMFYEGYQNVEDENVNFHLDIPIEINYRPEDILINNVRSQDSSAAHNVYKFYNQYFNQNLGWQDFAVQCLRTDPEIIKNFEISFNPQQINMKYQGTVYPRNDEERENDNFSITLSSITEPLQFCGSALGEGQIKVKMTYNLLREESLEHDIYYKVVTGPTEIDCVDHKFLSDAVYVGLNETQTFDLLYADADFDFATAEFMSQVQMIDGQQNSDVVDIDFQGVSPVEDGISGKTQYRLNLSITAKRVGRGQYRLTLDNGVTFLIKFQVVESLDSLSTLIESENGSVSYYSSTPATEEQEACTTIYINNRLNGQGEFLSSGATVYLIANDQRYSTAIVSAIPTETTTSGFTFTDRNVAGQNFVVHLTTTSCSQGSITYLVYGQIVQDFWPTEKTLTYTINVVSYNEIGGLNIYKTQDGTRTYAEDEKVVPGNVQVYSGTDLSSKNTAKFVVQPKFDGYLFYDPADINTEAGYGDTSKYVASSFDKRFIYWRVANNYVYDTTSQHNLVDYMIYQPGQNNRYVIDRVGTFDTSTMTFVASNQFENVQFIAYVRQLGKVETKSFFISAKPFNDVTSISKYGIEGDTLTFSPLERQRTREFFVYVNPTDATDPSIDFVFNKPTVRDADGVMREVDLFGQDGIVIEKALTTGSYHVIMTLSKEFLSTPLASQDTTFSGSLYIASSSWIAGNSVIAERLAYSVVLTVNFTNGTKNAPYLLETPEDVLSINEMPDKHYALETNIDLSLTDQKKLADSLPIGKDATDGFTGSLVGKNEYAQISGINISFGANNFYGLFSKISKDAIIEGVIFSGKFDLVVDVQAAQPYYVGLVAGQNEGQLVNIGVQLSEDSKVSVNPLSSSGGDANVYVGGVVGRNVGLIIQDYGEYVKNKFSYSQIDATQQQVAGKYYGMTPRILMFGGDHILTVENTTQNSDQSGAIVYVGGVTGSNEAGGFTTDEIRYQYYQTSNQTLTRQNSLSFAHGSIVKIDEESLVGYGYSDYLSYINIESRGFKTYAGGVAGKSSGTIVGYADVAIENNALAGTLYAPIGQTSSHNVFKAGKGIVVGGSIYDDSLFEKVAKYDTYIQYIGGVVGWSDTAAGSHFSGVTSRVSVVGSKYVGAIAGYLKERSSSGSGTEEDVLPAFAMQAVDEKRIGIRSAMVARVILTNEGSSVKDFGDWYTSTDVNNIAFADIGPNFEKFMTGKDRSAETQSDGLNVTSFVSRVRRDTFTQEANADFYYGDFIVVTVDMKAGQSATYSLYNPTEEWEAKEDWEFEKDHEGLLVAPNSTHFAPFVDEKGEVTSDVFFAFFFRSKGYVFQDQDQDISQSQAYLDTHFNTLSPSDEFYPITTAQGMILTSQSLGILTFDQSGKIKITQSGLAKVEISSILDRNNTLSFYLYVVDYFNPDSSRSILYPTNSNGVTPIEDETIILRGESSTNIFILPSNKTDAFADESMARIENGILYDNGNNIRLSDNEVVSANLKIYAKNNDTTCLYDSEKTIENPPIDVDINGQIITLRRNENTKEYNSSDASTTYRIVATPILKIAIDGKTYVCDINKKLENVNLIYRRGAKKIELFNYDTVSLLTSQTIEETLRVMSSYRPDELDGENFMEQYPSYVISHGGRGIFSTYDGTVLPEEIVDEVFKIEFSGAPRATQVGDSDYYYYDFDIKITFNQDSKAWANRYQDDIYGIYTITFFAKTDPSKFTSFNINLERTTVQNILIDNYHSLSQLKDFASTSHKAIPGRWGLLKLTLSPQDSDFDYIYIENDDICYTDGNGKANFSLVKLSDERNSNGTFKFETTPIVGQVTPKGVRYSMADIVNVYDNYDGIIYVRYSIGTLGVAEDGLARFNVSVQNGNERGPNYPTTLQLELEFQANADLVGKTPIEGDLDDAHALYYVAKGLRYQISFDDMWGYTLQDLTLSTTNSNLATIVRENGQYYVQITDRDIAYSAENPTYVDIQVAASQKVGEIDRSNKFTTRLRVLDYVVNYDFKTVGQADIVHQMENGVINVRIGRKQELVVDLSDFIEYDQDNSSIVSRVQNFMQDLSQNGHWTLYTNLLDNGEPNGKVITTEEGHYQSKIDDIQDKNISNNIYLSSQGLSIVPRATHNSQNPFYLFKFQGGFKVEENGGGYVYSAPEQTGTTAVETEFALNVYQSTSEQSPIPVDNYEDFMQMQPQSHYILTSDIVIPNSDSQPDTPFMPLSTQIASLDGNDYSIIFSGRYDFGDSTSMGLFDTIGENTLLKNVRIVVQGSATFATSSYDVFDAGLLAGTNLGSITNCQVIMQNDPTTTGRAYFTATSPNVQNQSYVAGLVARNSGFITHSRSSVYIKTTFNASGLVAINSGHIASSYFKGGKIEVSSPQHYAAGLVITNSAGAMIMTSYVSGNVEADYIFSRDTTNILYAENRQAGFVINNESTATISDCYSNIHLTGSFAAGFVYNNAGTIRNSFSLSVLERGISSAGFAMANTIEGQDGVGTFENCFYFRNNNQDIESCDGYADIGTINDSVIQLDFEGVTPLNRRGFENGDNEESDQVKFADAFATYAVFDLTTISASGVWVYGRKGTTSTLFDNMTFAAGRLELVSANVIASSRRNLSTERTTELENGEIDYQYDDDLSYPAAGSVKNPYIISSADNLESIMREEMADSGANYFNYRLVSDISYADYQETSRLYEVSLCGILEGNGMTISNIILNSAGRFESAGLFAEVGRSAQYPGTVMNLVLSPRQDITFNNASTVGGIAGVLNYGYLFNIEINNDSSNNNQPLNVTGANFVGSVVGRAQNNYRIFNAKTSLSAVANFHPNNDASFEEEGGDITQYSYAGALVGYAGGRGSIVETEANDVQSVMAARAGLAFGGIGRNATVRKLTITPSQTSSIRAYNYGGFVAGEIRGKLEFAVVESNGLSADAFAPFALRPSIPTAVGGVAGYASGAEISRVQINQSFKTEQLITSNERSALSIANVGGIIGQTANQISKLYQIALNADISANSTLGGAVADASASVDMQQIAIKSRSLQVSGNTRRSYIGGFVGMINGKGPQISILDSYVDQANLSVDTHVYSSDILTYAGVFVGDGKVATMGRCYSRATISVTLRDMRSSIGEPQEVTDGGADISANEIQRFVLDNSQPNEFGNSSAYKENVNIFDVYFLGCQSENADEVFDHSVNKEIDSISYRSNAKTNVATFHLNQIGQGSREMLSDLGTDVVGGNFDPLASLFDYKFLNYPYRDNVHDGQFELNQELYLVGDRYYVMDSQKVTIGDQTLTIKYYQKDTSTGNFQSVGYDEAGQQVIGTVTFAQNDLQEVPSSTLRGHFGLGSVWDFSQTYSSLLFEKMFSVWKS